MDKLVLFNKSNLNKILNKRSGESKFGEHVKILTDITNIYEQLVNLDVTYIVFGIKEDVGVYANYGKQGTRNAWDAAINSLVNIQSNRYTHADKVLILGHLDFEEEMLAIDKLEQDKKKNIDVARDMVSRIDKHVSHLIYTIIKAGKKPIIIGGGHNNAYGNMKGASLALQKPVNVVNLDAHTDFRREEGRHSGNGFSYAYAEGFLKRYFIFGIHENYVSENVIKVINKLPAIAFNTFEDLHIRNNHKFKSELKRALEHVGSTSYGIEIDCDAIQDIATSQLTPSGFSVNKARSFVNYFSGHPNAIYLHICEASPTKKTKSHVGKLISYLIIDFIKSK